MHACVAYLCMPLSCVLCSAAFLTLSASQWAHAYGCAHAGRLVSLPGTLLSPTVLPARDEPVFGVCDRPRTRYCPPGLCTCLLPSTTSGRMRPSRSTCAHPGGTPHTCPPMSTLSPRTMVRHFPGCRLHSRLRQLMRGAILRHTLASQESAPRPAHAALQGELQTLHGRDAGLPGRLPIQCTWQNQRGALPFPCTCQA